MLALLRWEQGRLHDAAALLRYGAQAYGELKRRHDQGVCLVLVGLAYMEAGEIKRAPAPLLRGLMSLDDSEPSRLSACGWLSLALAFALLGWEENAREAREQAWLSKVAPEAAELAEVIWLDGRVAAALGETEEADRLLDSARVQLLASRRIPDAALASLDLAALYAETGRPRRSADWPRSWKRRATSRGRPGSGSTPCAATSSRSPPAARPSRRRR
jgi:tetratricopeptide (TPR) repeat protein